MLKPHLRERERYIICEVLSEQKIPFAKLQKKIREAHLLFLGQLGCAKAGIVVLKETWENNRFILKTNNQHKDEVIVALGLIKELEGEKCRIKTIRTCGTLKKAKEIKKIER